MLCKKNGAKGNEEKEGDIETGRKSVSEIMPSRVIDLAKRGLKIWPVLPGSLFEKGNTICHSHVSCEFFPKQEFNHVELSQHA